VPDRIDQQQPAQQLVEQARADGVDLVGPAGCWLLDRILLGAEDGFCDHEDSQDDAQDAQAPAVSLLGGA
jgi:hypothetical protein